MKRFALLTLALSFAATHLSSAEDTPQQKQVARRNAAVQKMATRNANVPRPQANNHAQQSLRVQRYNAAGLPSSINRTHLNRGNAARVYSPNHIAGATVENGGNAGRVWRGRDAGANNGFDGNVNANRNHWRDRNDGDGDAHWRHGNDNNGWRNGGNGDVNRENWHGHRHDWDRTRRSRSYWTSRYDRFALFGGGYYYWDAGYWYPAYGYDPYYSTYSYDAPIYSYDNQDPGEVISNVQGELQRRGYYRGSLDGTYGPMTRRALQGFQRDNGLSVTGQIDEDTLGALGLQ